MKKKFKILPIEYRIDYKENRWLSLVEAAIYVGLSKETIYRRIYDGTMPHHRVGKLYRFRTQELDSWVTKE